MTIRLLPLLRLGLLMATLIWGMTANAQNVDDMVKNNSDKDDNQIEIVVYAPSEVEQGMDFGVSFTCKDSTLSIDKDGTYINELATHVLDSIGKNNLTIVFGPSVSQQVSYTKINGNVVSRESITYTYTVRFVKLGTFSFPSTSIITTSDKLLTTKSFQVKVVSNKDVNKPSQVKGKKKTNTTKNTTSPNTKSKIKTKKKPSVPIKKCLVVEASVDKNHVCLGDTVDCEFRIYTNVDLTQFQITSPNIDNTYWKVIELPSQKTFESTVYQGDSVISVLWSKYSFIPLQAGEIRIQPTKFIGVYTVRYPDVDPFDAFFNGGTAYREVDTVLYSNPLSIQVDNKEIPERSITFDAFQNPHALGLCIDRSSSMEAYTDTCDVSSSLADCERIFIEQFLEDKDLNDIGFTLFAGKPYYPSLTEIDTLMSVWPYEDGSSIYDAIMACALREGALFAEHPPFSIVLLTDGDDNGSRISEKTLTNLLLRNKIRVDVIAYARKSYTFGSFSTDVYDSINKSWYHILNNDYGKLQIIAEATNGLFIKIDDEKQIPDAVRKVKEAIANGRSPMRLPDKDFSPDPILLHTLIQGNSDRG